MSTIDTCALCGEDSSPVLVIGEPPRVYLSACALCLIRAFDTLTGYKLEKLYMQYERLKAYHAEQKRRGRTGFTGPRKGETFAALHSDSTESS